VQQICHQLRSADAGGDMSFGEISQVVPWLELAVDLGQDLEAAQYGDANGKPRFFKSHAWERDCPKFQKTIVCFRDPCDVVLSFYHFFEDWFFEKGTLGLDRFANEFWLKRGTPPSKMQNASYFVFLTSWLARRDDPNVLLLFYEDLKEDLQGQVRRIARFVSTEKHQFDTEDVVKLATERSTWTFMKEHSDHFDEKYTKWGRNEACGLPKNTAVDKPKLKEGWGQAGKGDLLLSDDLKQKIEEKWKQTVEPVTGCSSYQELRNKFSSEFKR
jgi:hypothetical protein